MDYSTAPKTYTAHLKKSIDMFATVSHAAKKKKYIYIIIIIIIIIILMKCKARGKG
jgi:t-SNARE complex subunit (syntaxin)